MIRYLDSSAYGRSELGWLDSRFHFSFADYFNKDNMKFGILRVVNDDLVQPKKGFDTHPHRNMEILSYVVEGALTHRDSMGNTNTLTRGQVQYMSAGKGVEHSEFNSGEGILRFLQIWILPDANGYEPNYGDRAFSWNERKDRWLTIASGDGDPNFPIQIHADVHVYATTFSKDETMSFDVEETRQAYMIVIDGDVQVQDIKLQKRDALEIVEEQITLHSKSEAHVLMIEMPKEKEN